MRGDFESVMEHDVAGEIASGARSCRPTGAQSSQDSMFTIQAGDSRLQHCEPLLLRVESTVF